ncbi:hypothetical protein niasHT_014443 [Heterodera trifolii]|uniref:CCHC-type domain-containing protein n=1 Tax=Heterodera trifolii TaxID=157864 RepID=A0ABD2L1A0_9BILA
MTMNTTGSDGLDGEADELVLKDEISGSDEDRSDSSSVQILDDEMDAEEGRRKTVPKVAPAPLEESGGELPPSDAFVVDTEAVEEEAENSAYQPDQRGGSGTNAQFSFAQVISHFTPVPKESKRSDGQNRSAGKTCFNCGKVGHELSKCPEPRDARRISQNRNSFGRRRESAGVAPRFHEQRQGPQPGVVSDELRDALNIGPHELPPWIYRMRKLGLLNGYPPAYRNRATERLTVKFHLDEEVTTTDGHRRKRKHAEATGEGDQCQIQPEKLIRYPGFNYSDDNCLDKDSHHWVIPPWDTFVQAQQHHIDTRRHQQTQDDNDKEEEQDGVVANKRSKVSVTLDETEEISVLDEEEEGKEEEDEEAEEGELTDEEEEENDADVLFVDARSRTTKKKKKGKSGANVSLEEGEIVDESEEEQQQQQPMDMDLRTHSDRNNGKTKDTDTAENDDKVTKRREKRSIGKRTTKKLGKKRRKDEAVTAPPITGDVPPSSTTATKTAAADVPPPPCPSATENGQGPSTTTTNAKSTTTTANNSNEQQEKEEATAMLLKMQLGTPVPMSHNVCADKPDYAVEKPALEKWSIGIQAFQHQPPASSTGFFKRMHKIVKSVRKNGPAGVEGGGDNDNNKKDNEENGKKAKEHQKR